MCRRKFFALILAAVLVVIGLFLSNEETHPLAQEQAVNVAAVLLLFDADIFENGEGAEVMLDGAHGAFADSGQREL